MSKNNFNVLFSVCPLTRFFIKVDTLLFVPVHQGYSVCSAPTASATTATTTTTTAAAAAAAATTTTTTTTTATTTLQDFFFRPLDQI